MPRRLPDPLEAATHGDVEAVRDHILDAAHRVVRAKGLAAASTRRIAEEAGIGFGTLYNYFENRPRLLARAIVRHARSSTDPVAGLVRRAGRYTVAANLRYFVDRAATALDELVPLFAAAMSEPAILTALREEMTDVGPMHDPEGVVEAYLKTERDLGRISATADYRAAAGIVVGLCHDDAFWRYLSGGTARPRGRAREIDLLVRGLAS